MSRSSFMSVALAVGWRNVHNYFTNPAMIVPGLLFPLFFFTAFAGGLSRVDSVPGFDYAAGYTAFVYGFVLLQASAFGGIFTGFSIARDFESGFSRRMMLAAPHRGGIIAGYWVAALTRAMFNVLLITVVALIAGLEITGGPVDLLGLYTLALIVNAAAMLFGSGVAMRLRTMQAGPLMQMPVFLVLFLAPVYVPLDLLSGWVHAVAKVNPFTPMIETGRDFISGSPATAGLAYGLAAALVVLFGWWAVRGLRSAEAAGG
jgi:ABC-2 type transport system permease protein